MKIKLLVVVTGLLSIISLPVHAHTGLGTVHGVVDGLLHPLTGIDHLLVILAVGLLAVMRGGRELWLLPASFLLMMTVGAGLHFAGFTLSAAETWVAFSVMASGLLLWTNYKVSSGLAVALVAVFALGHGYVHGSDLQTGADVAGYTTGFLLTTALLQGLSITMGLLLSGTSSLKIMTTGFGLLCAVVGTTLLVGA
ncbi:HupE/UreJ family protein [Methylobacter sp. S3L5C]|uniref:HupE/UreJ family protein n=1 Tax=Methylobacter sp. S3L5C TaxID=2839024 RepID=UPI001FACAED3|nr:HupE/UreJ family protein [Methylobacter sp. S3L5C]UOA10088.1 HupE/UreJ family protein [Methylobacter sp. S3L5C]